MNLGNWPTDLLLLKASLNQSIHKKTFVNKSVHVQLFVRTLPLEDDFFLEWHCNYSKLLAWQGVALPGKYQLIKLTSKHNYSAQVLSKYFQKYFDSSKTTATNCKHKKKLSSHFKNCVFIDVPEYFSLACFSKEIGYQTQDCNIALKAPMFPPKSPGGFFFEQKMGTNQIEVPAQEYLNRDKVALVDQPVLDKDKEKYISSEFLVAWTEAYFLCKNTIGKLPEFASRHQLQVFLAFHKSSAFVSPVEGLFVGLVFSKKVHMPFIVLAKPFVFVCKLGQEKELSVIG